MNSNGHKERPILFSGEMVRAILEGRKTQTRRVMKPQPFDLIKSWPANPKNGQEIHCPYGNASDRLWVRETFAEGGMIRPGDKVSYAADWGEDARVIRRWKPSIFMPRWASRITLEITNVRVERLQEITAADAKAEGVEPFLNRDATAWRAGFQVGWDALNAKRGHSWEKNPWVWVIEFKKV